jgi:hypothetical protein
MASARPLRDVFADLAGEHAPATDPAEVLAANGHPGLPDGLVAEAVVNYADTAPIEVAAHLSPYVIANSPVPLGPEAGDEPMTWLHALTSAPVVTDDPLDAGLDPHHVDTGHSATGQLDPGHLDPGHLDPGHGDVGHLDPGLDLDFGGGDAHDGLAQHADPNAAHHDPYGHDPYAQPDPYGPAHGVVDGHLLGGHESDLPTTPDHPLGHETFDPHHSDHASPDDAGPAEDPGHHH